MQKTTETVEVAAAIARIRSFRLGWHEATIGKPGAEVPTDKKAYMRGVERGAQFREWISATRSGRRAEAAEAEAAE